jgi:hypothetical protein
MLCRMQHSVHRWNMISIALDTQKCSSVVSQGNISIYRRCRKGFHNSGWIYLPLETTVAMIRRMYVQVWSSPALQLTIWWKLFHGPT